MNGYECDDSYIHSFMSKYIILSFDQNNKQVISVCETTCSIVSINPHENVGSLSANYQYNSWK